MNRWQRSSVARHRHPRRRDPLVEGAGEGRVVGVVGVVEDDVAGVDDEIRRVDSHVTQHRLEVRHRPGPLGRQVGVGDLRHAQRHPRSLAFPRQTRAVSHTVRP
jgi:hypothetical protein